jgi:hypothetical protein
MRHQSAHRAEVLELARALRHVDNPVLDAGRIERRDRLVERFGTRGLGHAQTAESVELDAIERAAEQQHAITDQAM